MRGAIGKVRVRMNKVLNESVPMDGSHDGGYGAPHGNGHDAALGNGHGEHAAAAVPAGTSAEPSAPGTDSPAEPDPGASQES
jgi:hypothetical protein